MLSADAVSKSFPTRSGPLVILKNVSFQLEPGDTASIVGPSGSGKSTLLNILGTLEAPSSGDVRIDDQDPFSLDEPSLARFRNEHVGFIFQEHHLLPQCTLLENVLLPAMVNRDPGAPDRAAALLDRVGLSDRLDHTPAELSGGERQRAAIARALINQPSLILADEPTGSLDPSSARNVADLLDDLQTESDTILIVVTHNLDLARRYGRKWRLDHATLVDQTD